jgi:hypothetical protein
MSMITFERKNLTAGWVEYRFVMPAPPVGDRLDLGEITVVGQAARLRLTKWILSHAAGFAMMNGNEVLEGALWALWGRIERNAK